MENKSLWNRRKAVPDYAQSRITGGRLSGKTDIKPQWRIEVLTEEFGMCGVGWYYTAETETHESDGTISAHVNLKLYVKVDGEWSMPIEGQGGAMLVAKEKAGPYHDDDAYKKATTDALSVACKQLGIGSDIYMGNEYSKYMQERERYSEQIERIESCQTMDALKEVFAELWKSVSNDLDGQHALAMAKDKKKKELK